jgi:hypothetical protein
LINLALPFDIVCYSLPPLGKTGRTVLLLKPSSFELGSGVSIATMNPYNPANNPQAGGTAYVAHLNDDAVSRQRRRARGEDEREGLLADLDYDEDKVGHSVSITVRHRVVYACLKVLIVLALPGPLEEPPAISQL